jgi:5-methylcytosine-specific restriction endonuclease McrA
MPSNPNTLCGGTCGRLIWPNYSAPGRPVCRDCRRVARGEPLEPLRRNFANAGKTCSDPQGCARPARTRGLCKTHYNKANGYYIGDLPKNPDRERARLRLKTHRRKDWSRLTDVTPEFEMALRVKAKRCPLCSVKLIDRPYEPCSKELDHIIPKGVGGTHTIGNVRIICRTCNLARPKDGSDYTGPVTLWAQEVA